MLCPWQAHAATGGEAQEWARAMLGTVGRGGNAQARAASGALMPYLLPACFGRAALPHCAWQFQCYVLYVGYAACRQTCMYQTEQNPKDQRPGLVHGARPCATRS